MPVAHLALVIDADAIRRGRFAAAVRALFADLPGTTTGTAAAGPVTCLWATSATAPLDVHREGDRLAVLVGYAVDDAGRWVGARDLADAWLADDAERTAHDGYHVGVAFDPARGLVAGVDPLGLFPLYHTPLPGGGCLVATTPAAFGCHPDFRCRIDRTGLAGILLVHGLLDDRPLLAGTRRLAAGHRLRVGPGGGVEERRVFTFEGESVPRESLRDTDRRIGDLLLDTLRRHRPPGDDSVIMLSGGLDSRFMAGCLADLGIPTRAVSFGRSGDYEVRAARRVAAAVGIQHEIVSTEEVDAATFLADARRTVAFNHLSSGPAASDLAAGLRLTASRGRFLWSGMPIDWVFEPVSDHNGYDAATGTWSFDRLLPMVNAWGVPVDRLPGLLGIDGRELCNAVLGGLEALCAAGPLPPERQSAVIRWNQRVRNHLGSTLHLASFTSWPLMPATDRRFFSAIFRLPVASFVDRRIEKAILVERRPDLAAIPLDTNTYRFEPLAAAARQGWLAAAARSFSRRVRRAVQPFMPEADPRRYERLFNADHPRWRAVRRAVEPLRPLVHEHLDAGALAALLPPSDRRLRARTPVKAGSPIRLLCGLALLLDQVRLG